MYLLEKGMHLREHSTQVSSCQSHIGSKFNQAQKLKFTVN
jgi:hypothetical protein